MVHKTAVYRRTREIKLKNNIPLQSKIFFSVRSFKKTCLIKKKTCDLV